MALAGLAAVLVVSTGADLWTGPRPAGYGPESQRPVMELAVTVDDLPWTAAARTPAGVAAAGTRRLLAALAERRLPATGFVICEGLLVHPGVVASWRAAGHGLGSHSGRHGDLDAGPLEAWLADVRWCDGALRDAIGPVRDFRYPMLHQGGTTARRESAAALVAELSYRNAPVTIDNAEWVVAQAWADAEARSDDAVLDRLRDVYVEHIRRSIAHARETSLARFGRDVRHILLLHANALNAVHLGTLLDALAADGVRFIPLDSALADPVYALPDGYTGPLGLSWLYRVAPARPDLAPWDTEEEARVRSVLAGLVERRE